MSVEANEPRDAPLHHDRTSREPATVIDTPLQSSLPLLTDHRSLGTLDEISPSPPAAESLVFRQSFWKRMKRRSFLSLSALSAVPVAALLTSSLRRSMFVPRPFPPWRFRLHPLLTAHCSRGTSSPSAALRPCQPGFATVPGSLSLTRFDLTWDGKRIPIAERFWNDLTRARPSRPRPFGARLPLFPQ